MTNTASILLTAAQAATHSPRAGERRIAARYAAGIRRLIAEFEGIDEIPHEGEKPALNDENRQGNSNHMFSQSTDLSMRP